MKSMQAMAVSSYSEDIEDNRDRAIFLSDCNDSSNSVYMYILPSSIDDSYSPNIITKDIVGRSSPVVSYTGGTVHGVSFSVKIHEDVIPGGNILEFTDQLRAMTYPVYKNGSLVPPKIYARILNMYSIWGAMEVGVTYSGPIRDGRYLVGDFTFNIKALANKDDIPLSSWNVKKGDWRGHG